jgi:hypothetical protein
MNRDPNMYTILTPPQIEMRSGSLHLTKRSWPAMEWSSAVSIQETSKRRAKVVQG